MRRALSPIEPHQGRTNDYTSDASLRSGPSWSKRKASAAHSSVSDNTEGCFSERVARDPHDQDLTKEPSPVGHRDWFAHCDCRSADHRASVHKRDDRTGQIRGNSLGGPSSCAAPASTCGGAAGGQLGGSLGGVFGGTGTSTPIPPPQQPAAKRIVRVGSSLKPPRQTYSIQPEYPTLARQAHIWGV